MLDLDHVFTYHKPKGNDNEKYAELREAARAFAKQILLLTPPCADQSAAIRHVREALMTANASIALNGRLDLPQAEVPNR